MAIFKNQKVIEQVVKNMDELATGHKTSIRVGSTINNYKYYLFISDS